MEIDPSIELGAALEKFRHVFSKARYSYEKDSLTLFDMKIVELAEYFRKLVSQSGAMLLVDIHTRHRFTQHH